jgi:hypothetical protein
MKICRQFFLEWELAACLSLAKDRLVENLLYLTGPELLFDLLPERIS